jgi:hypothetical protein
MSEPMIVALNNTPPPLPVPQQSLPQAPNPIRNGGDGNEGGGDNNQPTTNPTPSGRGATPGGAGGDPDLIIAGQWIKLADGSAYQVKQGDTLSSIARRTNTTVDKLIEVNGMNRGLLDGNPFTNGPQTPPGSTVIKPTSTPASTPTSASTTPYVNTAAARAELKELEGNGKIDPQVAAEAGQRLDRIDNGTATAEDRKWIIERLPSATTTTTPVAEPVTPDPNTPTVVNEPTVIV